MSENLKKISELTNSLEKVEQNLQEKNSLLEFLLDHTTDGYWDWDVKTNYEYLSPKFKQQLGYEENEMENIPDSWMSICDGDDLIKAGEKIKNLINGESEEFNELLRFTHKQGYEIKILCRGKVVSRSENGIALRIVGTHTIVD